MTTQCGYCGTNLTAPENFTGRFLRCKCFRWTPIGSTSFLEKSERRCKMDKIQMEGVTLESKKMTNKEIISNFMQGKETSLKDMYLGLPSLKPYVIRATLNLAIKKNEVFERTGVGTYKVKN